MQNHHTGLFIHFDKSMMLIRFVRNHLRNGFNAVIACGPKIGNNLCEIILQNEPNKTIFDFIGAQELLKKYISILECASVVPNSALRDKPPAMPTEVIDLDLDETIANNTSDDVIVLDDTVAECESQPITQTQNVNKVEELISTRCDGLQNVRIVDMSASVENNNNTQTNNYLKRKERIINHFTHVEKQMKCENSKRHTKKCKRKKKILKELNDSSVIEILSDVEMSYENVEENNLSSNSAHVIEVCSDDEDVVFVNEESKPSCKLDHSMKKCKTDATKIDVLHKKLKKVREKIVQKNNRLKKLINNKKKGALKEWTRPAHLSPSLTKQISKQKDKILSVGTNIYNPNVGTIVKEGLRPIVIDGNNVAIEHGKGTFSVRGLQICVEYFLKRGHRNVKVFIPRARQNQSNFDDLNAMSKSGYLIFTPSRKVDNKLVVPYDDRFIIQYATESKGVVVSSDNYRDLLSENEAWRETIEKRLLMFTWVDDLLMFPQDPLGRNGPTLDEFLKY